MNVLIIQGPNLNLIGLINNAGISRRMPFEIEDINQIKNLYDVNVYGVLNITNYYKINLSE